MVKVIVYDLGGAVTDLALEGEFGFDINLEAGGFVIFRSHVRAIHVDGALSMYEFPFTA